MQGEADPRPQDGESKTGKAVELDRVLGRAPPRRQRIARSGQWIGVSVDKGNGPALAFSLKFTEKGWMTAMPSYRH